MSANKKLLTGEELISYQKSKDDKELPFIGQKEFRPTNSWLEKKQLQNALGERKSLLEEERVEKGNCLACATWMPDVRKAKVTKKMGKQLESLGHHSDDGDWLYPEEALLLLELNSLELTFLEVPLSIERSYVTLISAENGCTLNEYRTYSHLVRNGYRLFRHSVNVSVKRYEKEINLDQHILKQKEIYTTTPLFGFVRASKGGQSVPEPQVTASSRTAAILQFKRIDKNCSVNLESSTSTVNSAVVDVQQDKQTDKTSIEHAESQKEKSKSNEKEVVDIDIVNIDVDESTSSEVISVADKSKETESTPQEIAPNVINLDDDDDIIEVPIVSKKVIVIDELSSGSSSDEDTSEEDEEDGDEESDSEVSDGNWKRQPNTSSEHINVVDISNSPPVGRSTPVENYIPVRVSYLTCAEFLFSRPDPQECEVIDLSNDEENTDVDKQVEKYYKEIEVINIDSEPEEDVVHVPDRKSWKEILNLFPSMNNGFAILKPPEASLIPPGIKPFRKEYHLKNTVEYERRINQPDYIPNRNHQYHRPNYHRNYYRNKPTMSFNPWFNFNSFNQRFSGGGGAGGGGGSFENQVQAMATGMMQVASTLLALPTMFGNNRNQIMPFFNQMQPNNLFRPRMNNNQSFFNSNTVGENYSTDCSQRGFNHSNNFNRFQGHNNFVNRNMNHFSNTVFQQQTTRFYRENYPNRVTFHRHGNEDTSGGGGENFRTNDRQQIVDSWSVTKDTVEGGSSQSGNRQQMTNNGFVDTRKDAREFPVRDNANHQGNRNNLMVPRRPNWQDNRDGREFPRRDNINQQANRNNSSDHRRSDWLDNRDGRDFSTRDNANQQENRNNPVDPKRSDWQDNRDGREFPTRDNANQQGNRNNSSDPRSEYRFGNNDQPSFIVSDCNSDRGENSFEENRTPSYNRRNNFSRPRWGRRHRGGGWKRGGFRGRRTTHRAQLIGPNNNNNITRLPFYDSDPTSSVPWISNFNDSETNGDASDESTPSCIVLDSEGRDPSVFVDDIPIVIPPPSKTTDGDFIPLTGKNVIREGFKGRNRKRKRNGGTDLIDVEEGQNNPGAGDEVICVTSSNNNKNMSKKKRSRYFTQGLPLSGCQKKSNNVVNLETSGGSCTPNRRTETDDNTSTISIKSEEPEDVKPNVKTELLDEINNRNRELILANTSVKTDVDQKPLLSEIKMEIKSENEIKSEREAPNNNNDTVAVKSEQAEKRIKEESSSENSNNKLRSSIAIKEESETSVKREKSDDNLATNIPSTNVIEPNDRIPETSSESMEIDVEVKSEEPCDNSTVVEPSSAAAAASPSQQSEVERQFGSWAQLKQIAGPSAIQDAERMEVDERESEEEEDEEVLPLLTQKDCKTLASSSSSDSEDESSDKSEDKLEARNISHLRTVLSALQVIGPADFSGSNERELKISYDVYTPSISFKKTARGLPNYRLVVLSFSDPVPTAVEMAELNSRFEDGVPILMAVVLPDSISFFTSGLITLPTFDCSN